MDAPADELMLSIAGLVGHLELVGAERAFADQVQARYGAFTMPASPWVRRDFSLRLAFGAPDADSDVHLTAEPGADEHVHFRIEGRCKMDPSALDGLLRLVWSTLLPRHDGLLVSSWGPRDAEIAVLVPCESDAGGAPLQHAAPDDALSERAVAVRRDAAVGGWRLHGTPFSNGVAGGGGSVVSQPLRTIAFRSPSGSGELTVATVAPSEAARRLRSAVPPHAAAGDASSTERAAALAAALCSEVRCIDVGVPPAAARLLELVPHLGGEVAGKGAPGNKREMIAQLRAMLRTHRAYPFQPTGGSMRPWLKSGDALFIQRADESELAAGDVLLFWTPGRRPQDDALICHRMVARVPTRHGRSTYVTKGDFLSHVETFENRRQSEILGKVAAISRDGQTWPAPGRVGNLARLLGSLAVVPLLKIAGR
jgi:hypothetical protein